MRNKVKYWKVVTHDNLSVISTKLTLYDKPSKYVKKYSTDTWTEATGAHGILVFETRRQARAFREEMRSFLWQSLKIVRVECEGAMDLPAFCDTAFLARHGKREELDWYEFPKGTLAFQKVRIVKDK